MLLIATKFPCTSKYLNASSYLNLTTVNWESWRAKVMELINKKYFINIL